MMTFALILSLQSLVLPASATVGGPTAVSYAPLVAHSANLQLVASRYDDDEEDAPRAKKKRAKDDAPSAEEGCVAKGWLCYKLKPLHPVLDDKVIMTYIASVFLPFAGLYAHMITLPKDAQPKLEGNLLVKLAVHTLLPFAWYVVAAPLAVLSVVGLMAWPILVLAIVLWVIWAVTFVAYSYYVAPVTRIRALSRAMNEEGVSTVIKESPARKRRRAASEDEDE